MTGLPTAARMRAIEQAAIESGQVTGRELMERAGCGVVAAMFDEWPALARAPQRAVVLCGPGNNGGDGFVVARLLAERGWTVAAFLFGEADRLPPDARANFERWQMIGTTRPLAEAQGAAGGGLVVDALFGTGLARPLEGVLRETVARRAARCVAIDIPSGICADSGRVLGAAMRADLTVSFHSAKPGHYLADGPEHCGALRVADIGLPPGAPEAITLCPAPGTATLAKRAGGHKYGHGHALILSGGAGRTGAARLAARAALRIGAGVVTLGVPGAAQQEVACQIAALMLRRIEDGVGLAEMLADPRITALCLGPGLGLARARDLVPVACGGVVPRATVLDADALTAFEDEPGALFAMLHGDCVLTPHLGEFARLFPDLAAKLTLPATKGPAYSKADAAREAARRAGCVVLLKGPDTVIAAPDGRCSIHAAQYDRAAPWLATAGSGDVLAGILTGLMARAIPPVQAAEAAAWLHVEAARAFGPGLIAEDLPDTLPQVLRAL